MTVVIPEIQAPHALAVCLIGPDDWQFHDSSDGRRVDRSRALGCSRGHFGPGPQGTSQERVVEHHDRLTTYNDVHDKVVGLI